MHNNTRIELSTSKKILNIEKPTQKEFKLFSELVLKELGLEWGEGKKYLLHARNFTGIIENQAQRAT